MDSDIWFDLISFILNKHKYPKGFKKEKITTKKGKKQQQILNINAYFEPRKSPIQKSYQAEICDIVTFVLLQGRTWNLPVNTGFLGKHSSQVCKVL